MFRRCEDGRFHSVRGASPLPSPLLQTPPILPAANGVPNPLARRKNRGMSSRLHGINGRSDCRARGRGRPRSFLDNPGILDFPPTIGPLRCARAIPAPSTPHRTSLALIVGGQPPVTRVLPLFATRCHLTPSRGTFRQQASPKIRVFLRTLINARAGLHVGDTGHPTRVRTPSRRRDRHGQPVDCIAPPRLATELSPMKRLAIGPMKCCRRHGLLAWRRRAVAGAVTRG